MACFLWSKNIKIQITHTEKYVYDKSDTYLKASRNLVQLIRLGNVWLHILLFP
jgi:hypothetical protein